MKHSIYPNSFITSYCAEHTDARTLPTSLDIVKKETITYGVGIFACRSFIRGETIGHFIAEPTSEIRQHTLQRSTNDNLYDPYFIGFLLHSCDPNVVLNMHAQKVFCIRDIAPNEPLLMDYASTEDQLFNQFACKCSAPNCRHWITGRAEFVNQEGRHYINSLRQFNPSDITVPDQLIDAASHPNHDYDASDPLYQLSQSA